MPPRKKTLSIDLAPGQKVRTKAQIELGMRAIIRNGGAITQTARELGLSMETVRDWKRDHKERYAELEAEMGPELEAQAVEGLRAFVLRAEAAKLKALETVITDLDADNAAMDEFRKARARGEDVDAPSPRVRNPAGTLKDVSIAQGISVQKVLELTNRPTQIVEHRSPQEAYARLRALGAIIEGTAEPITDEPAMLEGPTATGSVPVLPSEATEHGNRHDQ